MTSTESPGFTDVPAAVTGCDVLVTDVTWPVAECPVIMVSWKAIVFVGASAAEHVGQAE